MKKNNKKGFTIVELVIVIAAIGVLTAILIPTFVNLTKQAQKAEAQSFVKNVNTQLALNEVKEGKNATAAEALADADAMGFDIAKITPFEGNDIIWDEETDRFAIVTNDFLNNRDNNHVIYKDANFNLNRDATKLWKLYDGMPETQTYSIVASEKWDLTVATNKDIAGLTVGFDAYETEGISSISYNRAAATEKQTVIINTNGGTLTINAPKDVVKHFGTAAITTLTAVDHQSYYESGEVDQVNIKKGRLVLTNAENASVGTVYIQATGESYDNVIIATQKGAPLPNVITRDKVPLPEGEATKTVVTIQTNVNENGEKPEKTETINLYSTKGTSGNDVYEASNGYDVSDLALLVVEASSNEATNRATEQIADPKVVAKVSESKTAVLVESETELKNALDAHAKYIKLVKDFSATSFINVKSNAIIDGDNNTITTSASRILRVTQKNVDLKLQNITLVGGSATERGVQIDGALTGQKMSLLNVNISGVTHYGVNIQNDVDVDLSIENSNITSWGALNLWSAKYDVVVKNSTLNGVNDKDYNKYGWNDFATIVLEGDTTGKTDDHSSVVDVKLINTTITANSTKNNKQALIGFNSKSTANTVSLENCKLELDGSIYTSKAYDHGEGNQLIIDGQQFDVAGYYEDYIRNVRGYSAYVIYHDGTYNRGANLTIDDALSQSKLSFLRLEKDVSLSKDYVLEGASVYSNYIFIYLQGHKINRNGQTLKLTNDTVVITDSYDSLMALFSANEGYHIVEDTNGENGPFVYFVEANA